MREGEGWIFVIGVYLQISVSLLFTLKKFFLDGVLPVEVLHLAGPVPTLHLPSFSLSLSLSDKIIYSSFILF